MLVTLILRLQRFSYFLLILNDVIDVFIGSSLCLDFLFMLRRLGAESRFLACLLATAWIIRVLSISLSRSD